MRTLLWATAVASALLMASLGAVWAEDAVPAADLKPEAKAVLKTAEGKETGEALFYRADHGVKITLTVKGMKPGEYAFHVHEAGLCEPPKFQTAGGHFNPLGKQHGMKNPAGAHAGDMPNLVVEANGEGTVKLVNHDLSLDPGPGSLFKEGGTAVVIHAAPDDHLTDPAGNAGDRIICGVVEKIPAE